MKLNKQETATVLAALRHFQTQHRHVSPEYLKSLDHFEDVDPMTSIEIDELCERLNFASAPNPNVIRAVLDIEYESEPDPDEAKACVLSTLENEIDNGALDFSIIGQASEIRQKSVEITVTTDKED